MLRTMAVALALTIAATTGSAAAPPVKGTFASPQHLLRWINLYRRNPEPKLLPLAVKAMSALGLFRDVDAGGVYLGFMAGVLSVNEKTADALITGMFPLPPEEQVFVVRAIAYSGLDDWKGLLGRFSERMPARRVLIQRLIDGKVPLLHQLKLEQSPSYLDYYWGFYFGTGRPASTNRIIDTLAWAREANDLDKLTTGSMAKWTLANNAQQDKDLIDHLKREASTRPKSVAKELNEIVEAAETFETAAIRRQAMTSIEELRRKGPESARKLSFWGQAGQTALALGCVVAGALGHVEVGIPCIIGGAASSAALKFLTPQQ